MTEFIHNLSEFFGYPFVRYALIAGVLVALCSSLFGVTLVLKRLSFIGDGLSHVAFGALAVAGALGLTNDMYVVLPVTAATAVILLSIGQNSRIRGDAAIAMLAVGAMATGYLVINKFPRSPNIGGDVCCTLFGSTSILTIDKKQIVFCSVLAAVVVLLFIFMYNRIFSVTFDEDFAKATGIRVKLYNFVTALVISAVIVLAMNLVGSLLVSALIIFPAVSAMRVFKTFKSVVLCSSILSVTAAAAGVAVSVAAETPPGATIVVMDILFFFVMSVAGKIKYRG